MSGATGVVGATTVAGVAGIGCGHSNVAAGGGCAEVARQSPGIRCWHTSSLGVINTWLDIWCSDMCARNAGHAGSFNYGWSDTACDSSAPTWLKGRKLKLKAKV
jgi:hypothetical protein